MSQYENVKWEHLPSDDVDGFIQYAKKHGYVDKWGTIRVDFDDLCGMMRQLKKLSQGRDKCTCGAMAECKSN
jgi:hypothetical protein